MSRMSFLKSAGAGQTAQAVQLNAFVDSLRSKVVNAKVVDGINSRSIIAMESLSDHDESALNTAGDNIVAALDAAVMESYPDQAKSPAHGASMDAAALAGIYAGSPAEFLKRPLQAVSKDSNVVVVESFPSDGVGKRHAALEAYDNRENRQAILYSMTFNHQASQQDPFGETLWPTITLTNENVGFGITVNLMLVYDPLERKANGDASNFLDSKKNIIRAIKNPNILKKEQTRAIPVYRPGSAAHFSTLIDTVDLNLEGVTIPTRPLKFGQKYDLLSLSATDALLATGVMNEGDSLDPTMNLLNVYAKVGEDVLKFNVEGLNYSNFVANQQQQHRAAALNFQAQILIDQTTKQADGSDLESLAVVATKKLLVTLEIDNTGNSNLESGDTAVYGNRLAVVKVFDTVNKVYLDLEGGDGKAIADLFAVPTLDSYDLLAFRANLNQRQQGQLVDTSSFTQLYNIPLRMPVTAKHPMSNDGATTDASDVQTLIATTRSRMKNDSVGSLLKFWEQLRAATSVDAGQDSGRDLKCVGKHYVVPTTAYREVDVKRDINSTTSHERAADLQAVLVNAARDMSYDLYVRSEYPAAADILNGGNAPTPTVILATDPKTARYINVEGDLRTLSGGFDVKIVHTLDERMEGKIFVAFGVFDANRNSAPNPLNFGNLVWAPEIVLTANIARSGISKETIVNPRYDFIPHCPVLGLIEVKNLSAAATDKASFDVDVISAPVAPVAP